MLQIHKGTPHVHAPMLSVTKPNNQLLMCICTCIFTTILQNSFDQLCTVKYTQKCNDILLELLLRLVFHRGV